MKLFLFRLSLKAKAQSDAFERKNTDGKGYSREEWLKDIFSKQFAFTHRSKEFFFVPEKPEKTGIRAGLIVGWVARQKEVNERTAPSDGLSPTTHDSWQASLLLIDPTDHQDGQKVAFESRPTDVGQSEPVIASLIGSLNQNSAQEPFSISIFSIIQERSFINFALLHPGKIKSITYDVAVPNMFNGTDDFSNEIRSLRDSANVARIKTRLESDGAINTQGSQLDEIANHVESGGGTISAQTTDGFKYNSNDYAVSEEVETDGAEPQTEAFWLKILAVLDRIF
jgi:hypothetical protein